MSDAVERIWIDDERPIGGELHVFTSGLPSVVEYCTEYVHADRLKALEAENTQLRMALYDSGSNLMACISTIKFILEHVFNPESTRLFRKVIEESEKSVKKMETALRQKGEPDEK